jgi:anti-anti-sigma regulatory factor
MNAQRHVIRLSGDYDASRADELDAAFDRHGDDEPLAIDLEQVGTFDTHAFRSLMRFQRARLEAGRSAIVLLHAPEKLRHFINTATFDQAFELRD